MLFILINIILFDQLINKKKLLIYIILEIKEEIVIILRVK